MSEIAMTTAVATSTEPDGAPRLPILDILRGIAILGILFMNINDMGGSLFAFIAGDPRTLGWSAADQVAWWLREVLANGTARCLLEMLFGAGMVILTDRAATKMSEWRVLRAYAFRNIVLFLFGLVHVFILLWPGDILHTYGLAALVAMLFRRLRPRLLIAIGMSLMLVQLIGGGYGVWTSKQARADVARIEATRAAGGTITPADKKMLAAFAKRQAARAESKAEIAAEGVQENKARTGTAATWAGAAWHFFISLETRFLEILFVWEAAGTMLIGAGLFKLGVLQGARSRDFYLRLTLASYAVGIGCRAWAAWATTRFDHLPSYASATGELARLATTLGHVGLVNLLLMSVAGARLVRPFAAAGRTALSLYVAQTLICLWVLYPPWGLALYNRQSWAALMLTALAINAGLLWLANWWVRHYAIAPVEWAWRSVIAGQRLPFRHRTGAAAGGVVPAAA